MPTAPTTHGPSSPDRSTGSSSSTPKPVRLPDPPSLPVPTADLVEDLARQLLDLHQRCDHLKGTSLPDLLSAALTTTATELGGTNQLTRHHPESWAAHHVEALAALADYPAPAHPDPAGGTTDR